MTNIPVVSFKHELDQRINNREASQRPLLDRWATQDTRDVIVSCNLSFEGDRKERTKFSSSIETKQNLSWSKKEALATCFLLSIRTLLFCLQLTLLFNPTLTNNDSWHVHSRKFSAMRVAWKFRSLKKNPCQVNNYLNASYQAAAFDWKISTSILQII